MREICTHCFARRRPSSDALCCVADPYAGTDSGVLVKLENPSLLEGTIGLTTAALRNVCQRAFRDQGHKLLTHDGHIWYLIVISSGYLACVSWSLLAAII